MPQDAGLLAVVPLPAARGAHERRLEHEHPGRVFRVMTIEPRYLLPGASCPLGNCSDSSRHPIDGPVHTCDSVRPSSPTVENSAALIEW